MGIAYKLIPLGKLKRVLLIIPLLFLFVACEENTSDNNYEIDASFRYPSEEGNYWEYSCVNGTDSLTLYEGISFLKIINNDSLPDSCGNNVISLFKTDSIIYAPWWENLIFPDSTTDAGEGSFEPFLPDTVVSDTLFYSHSEEIFSYCSGRSFNGLTNPPYLQYPLTVGSTWTTDDSLFAFDYEVIGEETILIELKDGTSVNMNCFIITINFPGSQYYYLSSIGLVKSSYISEPFEVTNFGSEDTGETVTISSECTLIDYYMAD